MLDNRLIWGSHIRCYFSYFQEKMPFFRLTNFELDLRSFHRASLYMKVPFLTAFGPYHDYLLTHDWSHSASL